MNKNQITKSDIKEALLFVEWIIERSEDENIQAVEVIFNAIKNSNGYAENFKKAMVTAAEVLKRQYSEIKD